MSNPGDLSYGGGAMAGGSGGGGGTANVPATVAPFSPVQTSKYASPRSTVIIHQKSPLLVATPPQVTRALAYSHPFLLPLNRLFGLISWSTGDPWESFLFLCSFWAAVLYGDVLIVFAGPVLLVIGLMVAMYSRRFSPLSTHTGPSSSSGGSGSNQGGSSAGKDHKRSRSAVVSASVGGSGGGMGNPTRHQKSLDDIVDTLNVLTMRCNTLLDPLLKLTDFLSTQYSATTASTRPALVRLLMRMIGVLPVWIALSVRPLHFITGRRVIFVVGTLLFTWHSKPARVCRTLLWRSLTVRRICAVLTGLEFPGVATDPGSGTGAASSSSSGSTSGLGARRRKSQQLDAANHLASSITTSSSHRGDSTAGVRFSFTLFENQRRWIGIGWTGALLGYERAAWTDEHLNACPPKDEFQLPRVDGGVGGAWRWVSGSEWHVEAPEMASDSGNDNGSGKSGKKFAPSAVSLRGKGGDDEGWIYYDNNWSGGKAQDGWGRYTRRRRWVREAELVDDADDNESDNDVAVDGSVTANTATELPGDEPSNARGAATRSAVTSGSSGANNDDATVRKRKGFFGTRRSSNNSSRSATKKSAGGSFTEDEAERPGRRLNEEGEDERSVGKEHWEVGDDMKMAMG